jgi:hypothetical protein
VLENFKLIPGDYIVFGSDGKYFLPKALSCYTNTSFLKGLFDNMFDSEILRLVSKSSTTDPTKLSKEIAMYAETVSMDRNAVSPYPMKNDGIDLT